MSGNSERKLVGAINCPKCGFKQDSYLVDQELAYYKLQSVDGTIYGWLNAQMGLVDYGGKYEGIINFDKKYTKYTKKELVGLIDYLQCPLCNKRFLKGSTVFVYYLSAMEQDEYIFLEE